jgi:virginiamycin B lyase
MPTMRPRAMIASVVAAASMVTTCGAPPSGQPVPATVSSASPAMSMSPEPSAAPSTDTPVSIEAAGATRIEIAGAPDWVAIAAGSAWVAVDGGVRRVDATTGVPDGLIVVPGVICLGFDIGFDSLWAGSCDRHLLARIDPSTGGLDTPFIDLPVAGLQEEGSIGVGDSGVWLVSSGHELLHLDPVTNAVDGRWPLPAGAAAVRAGLGSVWVTISDTGGLLKIDPADPRTSRAIAVGGGPRFLAIGEDSVWVMNQADGTVSRIDASGTVVATIDVSDVPIRGGDIAVGGGSVWVRTEQDLVVRIDPATNAIDRRYGPPSGSGSVAVDDTAAWVTAHDTSSLWRLPLP